MAEYDEMPSINLNRSGLKNQFLFPNTLLGSVLLSISDCILHFQKETLNPRQRNSGCWMVSIIFKRWFREVELTISAIHMILYGLQNTLMFLRGLLLKSLWSQYHNLPLRLKNWDSEDKWGPELHRNPQKCIRSTPLTLSLVLFPPAWSWHAGLFCFCQELRLT